MLNYGKLRRELWAELEVNGGLLTLAKTEANLRTRLAAAERLEREQIIRKESETETEVTYRKRWS